MFQCLLKYEELINHSFRDITLYRNVTQEILITREPLEFRLGRMAFDSSGTTWDSLFTLSGKLSYDIYMN